MKIRFIIIFCFITKTLFAQYSNLHDVKLKKISHDIWTNIAFLSTTIEEDFVLNKIKLFNNRVNKIEINNIDVRKYLTINSNKVLDLDSQYFSYEEVAPISYSNKVKIYEDGFEFILNPKYMYDPKYFNDTDIVMYFIDNKNLDKVIASPLARKTLFYYQQNLAEVKELNNSNCGLFIVNIQREMIKNRSHNVLYYSYEREFLDNDSINNLLARLRYFPYNKITSSRLDNESEDVITESPLIIFYETNSKIDKINLEHIGFGFCLEDCVNGGINYNYEYFVIKRKNLKKVFSKDSLELLYLIVDLILNTAHNQ